MMNPNDPIFNKFFKSETTWAELKLMKLQIDIITAMVYMEKDSTVYKKLEKALEESK
jgi:hypothetical protein